MHNTGLLGSVTKDSEKGDYSQPPREPGPGFKQKHINTRMEIYG